MKRFFIAGVIALTAMVAMPTAAVAAPFTGTIDYTGTHTPDNTNLTLATQSTIDLALVVLGTGSFAALVGENITASHTSPLAYRPFGGPYTPLWSSVTGIAFHLNTLQIVFDTAGQLNLTGTGLFTGGGFDDTPGLWNMTLNIAAGSVSGSFSSSSSVVPEPAMLALFGLGLAVAGTTAARRRRKA